jgi:hypothetical protein
MCPSFTIISFVLSATLEVYTEKQMWEGSSRLRSRAGLEADLSLKAWAFPLPPVESQSQTH